VSIEDLLRTTMTEHGDDWRPPDQQMDELRRAIGRRRRNRIAAGAAVSALVVVAGGSALAAAGRGPIGAPADQMPPAASAQGPQGDSTLPTRVSGQHLRTGQDTHFTPEWSDLTLTYTPDRWDFAIGVACRAAEPQHLEVVIDGGKLPYLSITCDQTGTFTGLPVTPPRNDAAAQGFWQSQGRDVRLHQPMTITVKVGRATRAGGVTRAGKATTTGTVGVGVYLPG